MTHHKSFHIMLHFSFHHYCDQIALACIFFTTEKDYSKLMLNFDGSSFIDLLLR